MFLLSRLDAELLPIRREPVSLSELVADIAGKWQLAADAAGLRLVVKVDRSVRAVSADIGLIETVIENLLDNAVRHRRNSESVEIEVLDAGSGVAVDVRDLRAHVSHEVEGGVAGAVAGAAARARVIAKHGEAEDAGETMPRVPGRSSGLGLAIVRRIVALHGGTFEIRTAPADTAFARFVLP